MISDPMEFCRLMECSGVSSLSKHQRKCYIDTLLERSPLHWCAIVRTQKANAFLCHPSKLQQRHHLEALKRSAASGQKCRHTHPPLSVSNISFAVTIRPHLAFPTSENIVRPAL